MVADERMSDTAACRETTEELPGQRLHCFGGIARSVGARPGPRRACLACRLQPPGQVDRQRRVLSLRMPSGSKDQGVRLNTEC